VTELNTINAGNNPDLANSLVDKALAATEKPVEPAKVVPPFGNVVVLPSGYVGPDGRLITTVEVRELNGMDEEALSKVDTLIRLWSLVLNRGVVKIGDENATEHILDNLLIGDREALILGVYKATFGNSSNLEAYCSGCREFKTVAIDLNKDIKTKVLLDPVADRTFEIHGRKDKYLVTLPTGIAQKDMGSDPNRTEAELKTLLLENCVLEINDQPVISKLQIKGMGIADRTTVVDEIAKRTPGPQFDDFEIDCPNCGGKVVVPVTLGTIFRY
jgi:hypothetical protein